MNSLYDHSEEWGFPIQMSPDQSLLGSSPRLFAAYHVFLRLLVPRHPPYALSNLSSFAARSSLGNTKIRSKQLC